MHPRDVQCLCLVSKALQLGFGDTIDGVARRIQGLQPSDMGKVLPNTCGRWLSRFPFETLPEAGGIGVFTTQQGVCA